MNWYTDGSQTGTIVNAGSFTPGLSYVITFSGTTNWTSLGASSTAVGTLFTYNGAAVTGSGGQASPSAQNILNALGTGDTLQWPLNGSATYGAGATYINIPTLCTLQGNGFSITLDPTTSTTTGVLNLSNASIIENFNIVPSSKGCAISVSSVNVYSGWRITQNTFNPSNVSWSGYAVYVNGSTRPPYQGCYGLIDNNTFNVAGGNQEICEIIGPSNSWYTPNSMGTSSAVYIENNTVNGNGGYICDTQLNGRTVVRYNLITGATKVDAHGYASTNGLGGSSGAYGTGGGHSNRQIEVYGNVWSATSGTNLTAEFRGGTGMVFNNLFCSTWNTLYVEDYGYELQGTAYSYVVQTLYSLQPGVERVGCGTPSGQPESPANQTWGAEPFYLWNLPSWNSHFGGSQASPISQPRTLKSPTGPSAQFFTSYPLTDALGYPVGSTKINISDTGNHVIYIGDVLVNQGTGSQGGPASTDGTSYTVTGGIITASGIPNTGVVAAVSWGSWTSGSTYLSGAYETDFSSGTAVLYECTGSVQGTMTPSSDPSHWNHIGNAYVTFSPALNVAISSGSRSMLSSTAQNRWISQVYPTGTYPNAQKVAYTVPGVNYFTEDVVIGSPDYYGYYDFFWQTTAQMPHTMSISGTTFSTAGSNTQDGTQGVSTGTTAQMNALQTIMQAANVATPGTYTAKVGYFVTDQGPWNYAPNAAAGRNGVGSVSLRYPANAGALYQWVPTSGAPGGYAFAPYYTPYQYPYNPPPIPSTYFPPSSSGQTLYNAGVMSMINAGSLIAGQNYTIQFVGSTNFTALGASANTVGLTFTATGSAVSTSGLASTVYTPGVIWSINQYGSEFVDASQGPLVVQPSVLPEGYGPTFFAGGTYTIASTGNTNWTSIGAPSSAPGTQFVCTVTGAGSGTGIGSYTGPWANPNSLGLPTDTDSAIPICACLWACPPGQYVYLPAGNYTTLSSIQYPGGKNYGPKVGVTLRGAGSQNDPNHTNIYSYCPSAQPINMGTMGGVTSENANGVWPVPISGYIRGSQQLVYAPNVITGLSVNPAPGAVCLIMETPDNSFPNTTDGSLGTNTLVSPYVYEWHASGSVSGAYYLTGIGGTAPPATQLTTQSIVAASALVSGDTYRVHYVGTTPWASYGAANDNIGTYFISTTSSGTGTGLATLVSPNPSTNVGQIPVADMVNGVTYQIALVGVGTPWTSYGAPSATGGTWFTAQNGPGVGTGTLNITMPMIAVNNSPPSAVVATSLKANTYYVILLVGTSDFTTVGAASNTVGLRFLATGPVASGNGLACVSMSSAVPATSLVTGTPYVIEVAGTTTWTSYGAANNNVGTAFICTKQGIGSSGTGVASTSYGQTMYYQTAVGGAETNLTQVYTASSLLPTGTWMYNNLDSLGFTTIYVNLPGNANPSTLPQIIDGAPDGGIFYSIGTNYGGASMVPGAIVGPLYGRIGQWAKVTTITGGTAINLDRPLYFNFTGSYVSTHFYNAPTCGFSLENLLIQAMQSSPTDNAINISSINSWVLNVEVKNPALDFIYTNTAMDCEIRHCYIHEPWNSQGGAGYGMCLEGPNSNILVQDNIAWKCRHAYIQLGLNCGNIIAYNYSLDPNDCFPGPGTGPLAGLGPPYSNDGYIYQDFLAHGSHPLYTLYEGNVGAQRVADFTHGSSSHMVHLRNNFRIQQGYTYTPNFGLGAFCVDLDRWNNYMAFIGNVHGYAQMNSDQGLTMAYGSGYATGPGAAAYNQTVYRLGYDANSGAKVVCDTNVVTNFIDYGNLNYATKSVVNGAISGLPASYYLTSKPSWWDGGQWPSIGPDISPNVDFNPAYRRTLRTQAGRYGPVTLSRP